jgi:hypothetical protein
MPSPSSPRAALLVLLAAAGPAQAEETLSPRSLAAASGRPAECSRKSGDGVDAWAKARLPGLGGYCALLQKATTLLATSPEKAAAVAFAAESALGGRAAPSALAARALHRTGAFEKAWAQFERARTLDPRSIEPPLTLLDYARCAVKVGHREEARAAYHALSLRLEFLPDDAERAAVRDEAARLDEKVKASSHSAAQEGR